MLIYIILAFIAIVAMAALGYMAGCRGEVTERRRHDETLAEVKQQYRQQMGEVKQQYEQQIADLKSDHARQLKETREAYEKQVATLREINEEQVKTQLDLIREQMQTTSEKVLKLRQEELGEKNREQVSKIIDPLQKSLKDMQEALDKSKTQ